MVTDSITDVYFVTEESGMKHLKTEGVDDSKVHFTRERHDRFTRFPS